MLDTRCSTPNEDQVSSIEDPDIKMTFCLSPTPLDPVKLCADFTAPGAGAFICFEGRVRDNNGGEPVTALEYEAYEPLCHAQMKEIFAETRSRFDVIDLKAAHRTGKLNIGEIAVWIGVLAAHRQEAFAACRYIIDELKKRLPIWKKEYYADNTSQWTYCADHTHAR